MIRYASLFALLIAFSLFVDQAISQVATQPTVENFDNVDSSIPARWRVIEGHWRTNDGVIVTESLQGEAYIAFGEPDWKNYEVTASIEFRKVRNPSRWVSLLVRATPDGSTPWSQVALRFDTTQSNGAEFAVRTPSNSWSVRSKASAESNFQLNQPRQLKVRVQGSLVEAYLDSKPIVSSHLCLDRRNGCVGFGVSGCIAAFDNVTVRQLPRSSETPAKPSGKVTSCDVVAHRGFSSIAPENTLAAIREAINVGATGCEFDVYGCADGTVVLMHDKSVDRTTDGKGMVTELTLKQLRKLDAGSWKDKKYEGQQVPTLIEALTLLKGTKCQPVIELKMEGISQQVVDDIRALNMVDQVAVIAFSQNSVSEIRRLEPRLNCGWLCGSIPKEADANTMKQQADWLHAQAKACSASILDLNYSLLSPELVTELNRRKLDVWCWTVNEPVVMEALQQWGVDSITTDHPKKLINLMN